MQGEQEKGQDVKIAVMAEQMKHLNTSIHGLTVAFSDKINSLTDQIKSFITIADKKVDRDTYLDDRRKHDEAMKAMSVQLSTLEDFRKGMELGKTERKKIFGVTTGTLGVMIQLLTFLTLAAGLIAIFNHTT